MNNLEKEKKFTFAFDILVFGIVIIKKNIEVNILK